MSHYEIYLLTHATADWLNVAYLVAVAAGIVLGRLAYERWMR